MVKDKLVDDYFAKTATHQQEYGEKTIVLMQVGAFYEVYGLKDADGNISGSNIVDFSQLTEIAIVDKKQCVGKANVMMSGFRDFMIEKYLKKLQENGYTAVIYDQDTNAPGTTRSLTAVFSPGTYFSNESTAISNNTLCIWIEKINGTMLRKKPSVVIGVSNIDIYTGKTSIFEFKEEYSNSPTTYDELERYVSIYNPTEAIVIANMDNSEIDNIINYSGLSCSKIHVYNISNLSDTNLSKAIVNSSKNIYQIELVKKYYSNIEPTELIETFSEYPIAWQSFCFLMNFIYQHNPHLTNKLAIPVFENYSHRLILANHSLKQLNVISAPSDNKKYSSVLKLLNHCVTTMGQRRFKYNLLNPTTNSDKLNEEYDIIEHFINNTNLHTIRVLLSEIKDIEKLNRKLLVKKVTPAALYNLYGNLHIVKNVYDIIHNDSHVVEYLQNNNIKLNIPESSDQILSILTEYLNINLCETMDTFNFDVNFINSGVSAELDKLVYTGETSIKDLTNIKNFLSSIVSKFEKNSKTTDYVKIHETEKMGLSLIATKKRCATLNIALNKMQESSTTYTINDDGRAFELKLNDIKMSTASGSNDEISNEQIKQICGKIFRYKNHLKDELAVIYNQLIIKLQNYQEQFDNIINFITQLDLIETKRYIAQKYNYCKPEIDTSIESSFVDVKDLRHCLIEHIQTNEVYVPNDIIIGGNQERNKNGMLLYGTNAVGKTSLIKALGISIIMAQAGLYVPSSSFRFKPYHTIFTRILGNDNIFKGLSTFEVEMSELKTILKCANNNSLILGDELCSGTETESAISIFVAGLEYLHKKDSSFIFATHFHEIVDFDEIKALEKMCMKHLTVVYNEETQTLVYDRKLHDGPGDKMYGLEVCKSLRLEPDFLDRAHEIRIKYSKEQTNILLMNTSRYNSKKLQGNCELCGKPFDDVHHMKYQKNADAGGFINGMHKNHVANLMSVCKECHDNIHRNNVVYEKKRTTNGYELVKS